MGVTDGGYEHPAVYRYEELKKYAWKRGYIDLLLLYKAKITYTVFFGSFYTYEKILDDFEGAMAERNIKRGLKPQWTPKKRERA